MLQGLLLVLIIASWLYWLTAWLLVYRFFRVNSQPKAGFLPPVSILKPVRGLDFGLYENLISFCHQDYPEFELLFAVADPDDPAIPVIERLAREYPEHAIRLVITEPFGANRKASLLHSLAAEARYEVLVASDSDMRVTPDYLRRVVAPLANPAIGLVTCPCRGEEALNAPAGREALNMNASFLPALLIARQFLAMRFAVGPSIAMRRSDLSRMGGFAAVADYLADDYQIGARIASLGLKVHLSDYVMASVLGATNFRQEWEREVRWARCRRVSRPHEYPITVLTFATPLAAALTLLTRFGEPQVAVLITSLALRWLMAWSVGGLIGDRGVRHWMLLLPAQDLLSAVVWIAGGLGRHVRWRGERFLLKPDGRMEPATAASLPAEKQAW